MEEGTEHTLERLTQILCRAGVSPSHGVPIRDISIRDLDSLITLDMLLSAEEAFNVRLEADALLEAGAFDTLGSLVDYIDNLRATGDPATLHSGMVSTLG